MKFNMAYRQIVAFILMACSLIACASAPMEAVSTSLPTRDEPVPISPTPNATIPQSSLAPKLTDCEFPDSIDPAKRYLFYLHGKIIKDQGIPAASPDHGEYEYEAILDKLGGHGFAVISQARLQNTDGVDQAKKIAEQVTTLNAGVPAKNITVVGASKGASIAMFVSHLVESQEINIVIMAICHLDIVKDLKQGQISLFGNVLSIYDSADELAGSCQDLFIL